MSGERVAGPTLFDGIEPTEAEPPPVEPPTPEPRALKKRKGHGDAPSRRTYPVARK